MKLLETIDTKREQLRNGYFQSGTGPTTILILGSCRTLAYTNYLVRWNELSGNKLTILRIDPHDFHWNERDEIVDLEAAIAACEHNQRLLDALKRTTVFIHEWYQYFGMFCTSSSAEKSIYQFGLSPKIDICFPNWHDRFVLFQDQVNMEEHLREIIRLEGGSLSPSTRIEMQQTGLSALEKFYSICHKSSFPELAGHFKEWWTRKRFFWTGNHVSSQFTLYLFRQINERFLMLDFTPEFWREIESPAYDQFSHPCTPVTQYDVDAYGLEWGSPIEPLRIP